MQQAIVSISPDACKGNTGSHLLKLSGANTGNLLFTEAVFSQVDNSSHIGFKFNPDKVNSEYQSVVIPAANWINQTSDWGFLAKQLSELSVPICCIGLGTQSKELSRASVKDGTLKFLQILSEKSPIIGVRGYHTLEVLSRLGIRNSVVTGCPSLFFNMNTLKWPKLRNINSPRVGMSFTRYSIHRGTKNGQDRIAHRAFENNCPIVFQSEPEEVSIAASESSPSNITDLDALLSFYGCNDSRKLAKYFREKGKVFSSCHEWFTWTSEFIDLTISTRIHGCIASINSGVPAVLIAHDDRTQELGNVIGIPSISIDNAASMDSNQLLDEAVALVLDEKVALGFNCKQQININALGKIFDVSKVRI